MEQSNRENEEPPESTSENAKIKAKWGEYPSEPHTDSMAQYCRGSGKVGGSTSYPVQVRGGREAGSAGCCLIHFLSGLIK